MVTPKNYDYNVFINCPFDNRYRKLFRAIVFSTIDCGFLPRCALEITDSSVERLGKLFDLITECRLSIHDISRIQLDSVNRLPRFNMPLELGMFLGAKRFGSKVQNKKNCLIMDVEKYRYQKYMSDIAGKDIKAHSNDISKVIKIIRDWLVSYNNALIPGARKIHEKYLDFLQQLPQQCRELDLVPVDLTFVDYRLLAEAWLEKYDEEVENI